MYNLNLEQKRGEGERGKGRKGEGERGPERGEKEGRRRGRRGKRIFEEIKIMLASKTELGTVMD